MNHLSQQQRTNAFSNLLEAQQSKISASPQQLDVEDCHCLLLFLSLGFSDSIDQVHALFTQIVNSEIYDYIDGGFFSTSDYSKLLKINSRLINLLTKASGHFFEGNFSVPAINSAQWIIQHLQSNTGAFFNGTQSDQLSTEYYEMNFEFIKQFLDSDGFAAFSTAFAINKKSNKIYRINSYQKISDLTSMHIKHVPLALESARQQLITARQNKTFPRINHNICCHDNGKIISTLFIAARQFNRDGFSTAALYALKDIQLNHWDNAAKDTAHYLSLVNALIMRLQYQWDDNDYQWLIKIGNYLVESTNADAIIQAITTNPLDSTIDDLFNLYFLSFNDAFLRLANALTNRMYRYQDDSSIINISFLSSIMKNTAIQNFIVIRGSKYETTYWQQQLNSGYKPYNHVYAIPETDSEVLNTNFPITNKTQSTVYRFNNQHQTKQPVLQSLDNLLNTYS